MSNVNWFEIPATDIPRAVEFYGLILDEPLGQMPGPDGAAMHVFLNGEEPQGALVEGEPSTSGPLIYLNCTDIGAALARVRQGGGKVLLEETPIGPHGFIAQFLDSEGNRVALHRGAQ